MSWPAAPASGPSCPQPVTRPKTRRGLRARQASGPRPRRSITPGRKPSISASAEAISSSAAATASGCFRSRRDRAAAAIEPARRLERVERVAFGGSLAVDADDVSAHVGEQHADERRRADAGHLDDLEADQRTHERTHSSGFDFGALRSKTTPIADELADHSARCGPAISSRSTAISRSIRCWSSVE